MYLRAGFFSLGLLLLSRVLGLARESVQAATFGSTGMGDVVIIMFTLPDLLVGILISGALAYVLLPHWAQQGAAAQNASQKKVATKLLLAGSVLGLGAWLLSDVLAQALAPGLAGDMKALGATSLGWSALVLPLAMLAALWTTRLQHERDFIGMYAGNVLINGILVAGLLAVAWSGRAAGAGSIAALGLCLVLAMLARLGWLGWRLAGAAVAASVVPATVKALPAANVWLWAGLSSGLLLLLPLVGRSIASQGGEGALASFNYAWKLVELPLVLAVQLVASLAFPAITRTGEGTAARENALSVAFLLAWALACAAIAIVATFSLPLAGLLFGWGRMDEEHLQEIARWSAIGIWSLLPQALIAVMLTVMAISRRMHVAVWAYVAGLAVLLVFGLSVTAGAGTGRGGQVMWLLNLVLAGVAVVLMVDGRKALVRAFPWWPCLVSLLVAVLLVGLKPLVSGRSLQFTMIACCAYGLLVLGAAVLASRQLRSLLFARLRPLTP